MWDISKIEHESSNVKNDFAKFAVSEARFDYNDCTTREIIQIVNIFKKQGRRHIFDFSKTFIMRTVKKIR